MPINYLPTSRMPSAYEQQMAEARRRQAMAEALEAQAYRPLSGSDAPIPAAAPLVKALQGYLAARAGRQAQEKAEEAKGMESQYAERMLGRVQGGFTYKPDAELEQQMAKKPEETLTQYNERMAATPFVGKAAAVPDEDKLNEVTRQSQYRQAPEEALGMAFTGLGTAALRRAPLLAAALERSMTPAEAEEFYAPVVGESGQYVQFGKRGGTKTSTISAKKDEVRGSPLSQLIAERNNLKPGDPAIKIYDAAIEKETTRAAAPVTNIYGTGVEAGVDEQGNPVFFQTSRTGGAPSIVSGVRPSPKGMNESQAKAAGFADRIAEASPMLDIPPPTVGSMILSDVPGGNFALNPQQQKFFQAERNFINAVLRRESGAVISPDEFSNARKQYIPQPGDSDGVLEQKRRNRETVLRSLARDAGPSYQPVIDLPPR